MMARSPDDNETVAARAFHDRAQAPAFNGALREGGPAFEAAPNLPRGGSAVSPARGP
jgi:hypothetical protein